MFKKSYTRGVALDLQGSFKMKLLAHSHLLRPEIDLDLAKMARYCTSCLSVKTAPASVPLHPWVWFSQLYQHVHIVFAGPYMFQIFLLLVDSHSKWGKVIDMAKFISAMTGIAV